jgi:hypothetical protein
MQSGLSALLHLRATLDAIGDAVRDGRTDALLQNETRLADDLRELRAAAWGRGAPRPGADLAEWQAALASAHAALRRCRRLGSSARDVARAVLVAQGRAGAYDRGAQEGFQPARGAVDARG